VLCLSFFSKCLPHFLQASNRAYSRNWLKSYDQAIHQLTRCFNNGVCPDKAGPHNITDFLLTTTWNPKQKMFDMIESDGFVMVNQKWSHSMNDIRTVYNAVKGKHKLPEDPTLDELTPFYWSAGLVMHPDFATKYWNFLHHHKNMQSAPQISDLYKDFSNPQLLQAVMIAGGQFSRGQLYAGVNLNVYRRPKHGLVMTSFQLFNPNITGFQQLPWMINMNGVPIWSKSGPQTLKQEKLKINFDENNIHNPAVQQDHDMLLVSYVVPPTLQMLSYDTASRLFWPNDLMDEVKTVAHKDNFENAVSVPRGGKPEEYPTNSDRWIIGKRNDCFVAVYCTHPFEWHFDGPCIPNPKHNPDKDDDPWLDDEMTFHDGPDKSIVIPRLVCKQTRHSWLIVVGTIPEYNDIKEFYEKRLFSITVKETTPSHAEYTINVTSDKTSLHYETKV
jgi:hypothetical protein